MSSSTLKPGIASSLSSVPAGVAEARGRSSSRTARRRPRRRGPVRSTSCRPPRRSNACPRPCARADERSTVSPLCTIASVSACVSAWLRPLEVDGHAERGHLVVGDLVARVGEDEPARSPRRSAPRRRASSESAPRDGELPLRAAARSLLDDRRARDAARTAPSRPARRSPSRRRPRTRPRESRRRRFAPRRRRAATRARESGRSRESSGRTRGRR